MFVILENPHLYLKLNEENKILFTPSISTQLSFRKNYYHDLS